MQLSFENINAPELGVYGVDHVAVAEGLGCMAIRVTEPKDAQAAFATARGWHRVPVVVELNPDWLNLPGGVVPVFGT